MAEDESRQIVALTRAQQALAEARTVEEKVSLHTDLSVAMPWMRRKVREGKLAREHLNDVAEIYLDNQRGLGQALPENTRRQGQRDETFDDQRFALPKLVELGVSFFQAHRWRKIAAIPEDLYRDYIARMKADEKGELTTTGLLRLSKDLERNEVLAVNEQLVLEGVPALRKTYSTVVIDPPWDWDDEGDVSQYGRGHPLYAALSENELYDNEIVPVREAADANAHLYLWITNRSLPKGFALMEHWGFRYVTTLTWCKPSIGMGNYFRGSTEHDLFGVRGSLGLLRHDIGTWHAWPRGERHSAKPDGFFSLVESVSPGPWLEMFGHGARAGWAMWGIPWKPDGAEA